MNSLQGSAASTISKGVKNEADSKTKLSWASDAQGPL